MRPDLIRLNDPVFPAMEKQLIELALANFPSCSAGWAWLGVSSTTFYRWAARHKVTIPSVKTRLTFNRALRILLGPLVTVPPNFWLMPLVSSVYEDAKKTYHEKALVHHPDIRGGSNEKMMELNEAWQVVNTAFKRHGIE